MIDSFHSLRHHAVIGSNNQNRNICGISATHTHSGKRLVSRCIQESNAPTVNIYSIRTYVLCDTSGFFIRHICLTDCIEKGRLTVVNMTHNTDNRRSAQQIIICFFLFLKQFFDDIDLYFFFTDDIIINCNIFSIIIRNFRVHRNDLALQKQLFNDRRGLHLHLIGKLLDCKRFRKRDHLDLFFLSLFHFLLRFDEFTGFISSLYCYIIFLIDEVFP